MERVRQMGGNVGISSRVVWISFSVKVTFEQTSKEVPGLLGGKAFQAEEAASAKCEYGRRVGRIAGRPVWLSEGRVGGDEVCLEGRLFRGNVGRRHEDVRVYCQSDKCSVKCKARQELLIVGTLGSSVS